MVEGPSLLAAHVKAQYLQGLVMAINHDMFNALSSISISRLHLFHALALSLQVRVEPARLLALFERIRRFG